jgi:hypothetical protein
MILAFRHGYTLPRDTGMVSQHNHIFAPLPLSQVLRVLIDKFSVVSIWSFLT